MPVRPRLGASLAVLATCLSATAAEAIPAFARRYQTSCTTCHSIAPRLNAFGVAFRNNGYRIPPNDEAFVKVPDVPLGAPAWKRVWPDAMWPGGIPGLPPVAFRIINDVVVDGDQPARVDFDFPHEFEILAAGTAGDGISFLAEVEVMSRPATSEAVVSIERMFVQFDQLGGTTLANLAVGRFEMRAVPFSRYHRRQTPSDLLAFDFRSPADGIHFRRPQMGLEFWGAKSGPGGRGGVEYAVGVVNGTGPLADTSTAKDVYARAAYKFGGFGVTGSSADAEPLPQATAWRDDSIRLGVSSYVGTGRFTLGQDRFWRIGGDADVFVRDLNLFGVVLAGRDRFADGLGSSSFAAMSVEANYTLKPWVVGIVRYETVARDDGPDIRKLVPALVVAIRANVRVVTDWEVYARTEFAGTRAPSGNSRARVRLDVVF
jgi:hypothetical protein